MRRLAPLLVLAGLAGCTHSQDRYPSLLPRPIESEGIAEPQRPAPIVAPDPALDAQIADFKMKLAAADKEFATAAQAAEAQVAVARGVAKESPAWVDAQTALSTLAAARAPTVTLVADLERLVIDRGTGGKPPYPALDTAFAEAEAISDRQETRTDAIEAALGSSD